MSRDTKSGVIYAENFIQQVKLTATAIEDHSLLTFLPLHTSHPYLLSNTTFSPNDFLIKHLKQFYCDHVMQPCGLKLGHNVLSVLAANVNIGQLVTHN